MNTGQMSFESPVLGEALEANGTLIRPFAGVDSKMLLQMLFECESFPANVAFIRLDFGVFEHDVSSHCVPRRRLEIAEGASLIGC